MTFKRAIPLSLAIIPGLLAASVAAQRPVGSIEGLWLTDDRKGVVRISPCSAGRGAELCGNIARILVRDPGVPTTDVNNPDPQQRSHPLLGLRTLWGFKPAGGKWQGGRAYDPQSGKSYRSELAAQPDGSLKVTGCVLFICESRRWTRFG